MPSLSLSLTLRLLTWKATKAWCVATTCPRPSAARTPHMHPLQHRVMINMPQRDAQGRAGAYGGRKNASAYARVKAGTGRFTVNRVPLAYYFSTVEERKVALFPLIALEACGGFDVDVHVQGGGVMGQAGAIRNALARALVKFDPYLKPVMKRHNLLVVSLELWMCTVHLWSWHCIHTHWLFAERQQDGGTQEAWTTQGPQEIPMG